MGERAGLRKGRLAQPVPWVETWGLWEAGLGGMQKLGLAGVGLVRGRRAGVMTVAVK